MRIRRLARLANWLEEVLPERRIALSSGGEITVYTFSTRRQAAIAMGFAAAAVWLTISTTVVALGVFAPQKAELEAARSAARYERWIADRDARLSSAAAEINQSGGMFQSVAADIEKRHAALAEMLAGLSGGPKPGPLAAQAAASDSTPAERIEAVRSDQDRLIDVAETYARSRADRLKLAFRLAGLDLSAYSDPAAAAGGPLIDAKDPRALAAVLDVDEDFAARLQRASADLSDLRALDSTRQSAPLAAPTVGARLTSGFGARIDPFTGQVAFHPGQDFAGAFGSPIYAAAPGVVSFAGERSGYGETIEIDHGRGFKSRYAHLSAISVMVGQHVAVGQRIGAMGSTGRSTGTHLHYEVWANGRLQNPMRFLRAGDYVQQSNF